MGSFFPEENGELKSFDWNEIKRTRSVFTSCLLFYESYALSIPFHRSFIFVARLDETLLVIHFFIEILEMVPFSADESREAEDIVTAKELS